MLLTKKYTTEEFHNTDIRLTKPLWFVKLVHFEYWPLWIIYFPLMPYIAWLMLKCWSFYFYKHINPLIKNGGLDGESKKLIMDDISNNYKPATFLCKKNTTADFLAEFIKENKLAFPLIAKPDIGEQGNGVEKIDTQDRLLNYLKETNLDFIIQEYVDFPIELAIFYIRKPGDVKGKVTSVTGKKFLSVTGDGQANLQTLINNSDRARLQLKRLHKKLGNQLLAVPANGEQVVLEVIGNHCKGTMFIDKNKLINDKLNNVFNEISFTIPHFYYGRYDLKVKSIEDLYEGKNIRILELNGAGSIPAHIFDPGYKLINAWKDILFHWRQAGYIALRNKEEGIPVFTEKGF